MSMIKFGLFRPDWRRVALLALLGFVPADCGCRRGSDSNQPLGRDASNSRPFVFVYRTPGYPLPGEVDAASGLLMAVWADGRFMRKDEKSSTGFTEGRLNDSDIDDLRKNCYRLFDEGPKGNVVVDSAVTHIVVIDRDKVLDCGASEPVPTASLIFRIVQSMQALQLKDLKPVDSLTRPPVDWFRNGASR